MRTADKLYANIIKYQPQTSEIYGTYEPAMRDHAMAAVLNRRINGNLAVIYDRMLYPAMLDLKCAAILPDILKSVRFRFTDPAVKNVHARYEGLNTIAASEVKNGEAYLPVYFPDALIELTDDRGDGGTDDAERRRAEVAENQRIVEENVDHRHCQCRICDNPSIGKTNIQRAEQVVDTDEDNTPLAEIHKADGGIIDIWGLDNQLKNVMDDILRRLKPGWLLKPSASLNDKLNRII